MDTQPQDTRAIPNSLHILGIKSENFKVLQSVDITLDDKGNLIPITGPNGSGKTSLIDLVMAVLGGKDQLPKKAIRDGETEMLGRVTLGNGKEVALVVTRKAKKNGDSVTHSLKVVTADGSEVTSPQQVLDAIIGSFTFDPLAFAFLKDAEKTATLLDVLGLTDQLEAIDAEVKAKEQERLLIGRDQKTFKGAVDAQKAGLPQGDVPTAEVNIADLTAELNAAQDAKSQQEAAERTVEQFTEAVAAGIKEIDELKQRLAAKERDLESNKKGLGNAQAKLVTIQVPDIAAIQQRLAGADQTNQNVRKLAEYKRAVEKLASATKVYELLTAEIEKLRKKPEELLKGAQIGVEGLTVIDRVIHLNGIPLDQASTAQQILVGMRIGILANPTLKTMFIREGSLTDSKTRALIAQAAADNGFQIIMEMVDETGQVGFVLEEGRIVHEPEAVQA